MTSAKICPQCPSTNNSTGSRISYFNIRRDNLPFVFTQMKITWKPMRFQSCKDSEAWEIDTDQVLSVHGSFFNCTSRTEHLLTEKFMGWKPNRWPTVLLWRWRCSVVRANGFECSWPGFKFCSDHCLDLSLMTPESNPPHFVNSQLVRLLPVGILNGAVILYCVRNY